MPTELRARLQVAKWLYWESAHWDQACATIIYENVVQGVFGLGEPSDVELERGRKLLERLAKVLDSELETRLFVAGEAMTIADLSVAAPLCLYRRAQLNLDGFANFKQWMARVMALPAWETTLKMQTAR
jgi:glutathione S-transferase